MYSLTDGMVGSSIVKVSGEWNVNFDHLFK
jgi:hypothetical protein